MDSASGLPVSYNVRDVLTVIFKHKRKIVTVFLILSCVSLLLMFFWKQPDTYDAKARLMIRFGREFVAKSEAGNERQIIFNTQSVIATQIQLIKSREMILKIMNSLGPTKLYPDLSKITPSDIATDEAIRRFLENLKVEVVPITSMLEITFVHRDPDMAVKALNQLIELLKEKHLQTYSGNSTTFLEQQFATYNKQLKQSELEWEAFKQKHGVFSLDEQRSSLLAQRMTFEANLRTTESQIAELQGKLASIRNAPGGTDLTQEARARLIALQEKEEGLLTRYQENSRAVKNVRDEINALKKKLLEVSEDARKDSIAKLESEIAGLRARADANRRQIAQLNGQLHSLDLRVRESQDIKRDMASHESNYQTYLKRLEEARISDEMDRQKLVALKVVEDAHAIRTEVDKKRGRVIGIGFIGAVFGGFILAFLLEFFSPVLTTPAEAERRLGLPVLIAITKKE